MLDETTRELALHTEREHELQSQVK